MPNGFPFLGDPGDGAWRMMTCHLTGKVQSSSSDLHGASGSRSRILAGHAASWRSACITCERAAGSQPVHLARANLAVNPLDRERLPTCARIARGLLAVILSDLPAALDCWRSAYVTRERTAGGQLA